MSFFSFLERERDENPSVTPGLVAILHDVVGSVMALAGAAASGARQELDVLASDLFVGSCGRARGNYLMAFAPLDGLSNVDIHMPLGSIFSIIERARSDAEDFLGPGTRQVCAGYALYGAATLFVLTLGRGVHGFTFDRRLGELVTTHPDLRIPETAAELAIDASKARFWEPPIKRYVDECLAGTGGPREIDFDMCWVGSLVADVHRILLRGGVTLGDRRRYLEEVAPVAFLIEQAGGVASSGRGRLLEHVPVELDERVPIVLGSRAEVERIVRYHDEHDRGVGAPYRSPLFGSRSLYSEP